MAAHGRGLALSPVLCTVFCLILPPKTNNVWFASKSNSWFHGVHLYDSTFNWKCLKDLTKTWQKRPKSWLSETCWSCFTLWSVLLAVLAMFWDLTLTISDNLKTKRECLRSIHFRIQNVYIQMLAKHIVIYVSSLNKIRLIFQASARFVSALVVNLLAGQWIVGSLQSLDPCNRWIPPAAKPSTHTAPI